MPYSQMLQPMRKILSIFLFGALRNVCSERSEETNGDPTVQGCCKMHTKHVKKYNTNTMEKN